EDRSPVNDKIPLKNDIKSPELDDGTMLPLGSLGVPSRRPEALELTDFVSLVIA
ncbi:hypothetical protein IW136_005349, partial [Coemansia sp. RSA 678]